MLVGPPEPRGRLWSLPIRPQLLHPSLLLQLARALLLQPLLLMMMIMQHLMVVLLLQQW